MPDDTKPTEELPREQAERVKRSYPELTDGKARPAIAVEGEMPGDWSEAEGDAGVAYSVATPDEAAIDETREAATVTVTNVETGEESEVPQWRDPDTGHWHAGPLVVPDDEEDDVSALLRACGIEATPAALVVADDYWRSGERRFREMYEGVTFRFDDPHTVRIDCPDEETLERVATRLHEAGVEIKPGMLSLRGEEVPVTWSWTTVHTCDPQTGRVEVRCGHCEAPIPKGSLTCPDCWPERAECAEVQAEVYPDPLTPEERQRVEDIRQEHRGAPDAFYREGWLLAVIDRLAPRDDDAD
jgi:hypothetical protein